MSPAPAKISYAEIVDAAQHLLETQGLENLSMQSLAMTLDVRAPSLYKHIENKSHLVRVVLENLLLELGEVLENAGRKEDLNDSLRSMAIAYRTFAHEHSALYPLLYSSLSLDMQPDIKSSTIAVAPLLRAIELLVGKARSLSVARIVVAFTHGFVDMELAGAFRLGGNVEEAFELGITSLLEVLQTFKHPLV